MKNKSTLKIVHRQEEEEVSDISQQEIYHQLSQVKKDLESILTLLNQQLGVPLECHPS